MSDLSTLKYTAEHEWLLIDGDTATVGITDYAADKLGDVVYVDLPAVGSDVEAGKVVGEIESTKSVGELFAPVLGTVLEINDAVVDAPDLVNSSPFDDGWLIRITLSGDLPALLSRDEYVALTAE
ncbi:glycine cleavage system protein GcvH [Frondihabitans peucedani]|uniref:Glycine cleavage system H protein n=1 Tax=Frondihabitans peucedani TaxID=598626 RepID=A0ABP8E4L3_9MICO